MALSAGQTLAHYEILGRLGAGGMGEVWRARDTRLEREVAIKVLPESLAADGERLLRFEREAKTLASLNHAHIGQIFGVDQAGETYFLALELVPGEDLAQRLARGPLRLDEALEVCRQIAEGLEAAHEAGVVHRDLKPANVRITPDGAAKVLDFGLAKPMRPTSAAATAQSDSFLSTEEGVVLGTPTYMAPEQARGRPVDRRADIWAFGCVLYECLTGERAFRGDSVTDLLAAILEHEPDWSALPAATPAHVRRLLERCLAKDPRQRLRDIGEARVALAGRGDEAPQAAPSGPSRLALAAGGLALFAAGLGLGRLWRADAGPASSATGAELELTPIPLTSYPGDERDPSFSPDGNQIVFSWSPEGGEHDLYVKLIGPGDPIRLTDTPEGERMAHWSPDGIWIAVPRFRDGEGQLVVLPALGGVERILARDRRNGPIAWAPDSKGVLYCGGAPDGLRLAPLSGGPSRLLWASTDERRVDSGVPSPDGAWLYLWLAHEGDGGRFTRRVVVALGPDLEPVGEPRALVPDDWRITSPCWSADSRELFFIRSFGDANAGADTAMYRVAVAGGEPRRVSFAGDNPWYLDASREGNRLAYTRLQRDVNLYESEIGDDGRLASARPLALSSRREEGIAPAPDGARLAFASNRGGPLEIWTSDRQGSGLVQLTSMDSFESNAPRWSPDGSRIAFHATLGSTTDVFVVPASGGAPVRMTHDPAPDELPVFSADGRWIHFLSNRGGAWAAWKVPAEGGAAELVARDCDQLSGESPDGRWLYVQRGTQLVRIELAGGAEEVLADDLDPGWEQSGERRTVALTERGLYYLAPAPPGETGAVVRFLDLAGGAPQSVGRIANHVREGLSASRDGRYLYWSQYDVESADLRLVEDFR